jgi:hypothetical protein
MTPAGRPNNNMGKVVAVCTSATIRGESLIEIITQPAPTFCIQMLTLASTVISQSARNNL